MKLSISHFLKEMFLAPLPMVYILRSSIRFARVCSNVSDFNNRNQLLTASLLNGRILILKLSISHFLKEMFLAPLPMVYILRSSIRFARVCSNVSDFNNRNQLLTASLLNQGYRYNKIRKAFSKSYPRNSELIVKYNIG